MTSVGVEKVRDGAVTCDCSTCDSRRNGAVVVGGDQNAATSPECASRKKKKLKLVGISKRL